MERQTIEIKYPDYAYELQVDQYGEFEYWDAGNNIEAFYPYVRNKSGKIGYYNWAWRIVRTSDGIVIAQSKTQPASAPVADDPADTVADETSEPATHVSETVNGKRYSITRNAQGNYNVTQPGNVWTVGTWDEAQVALQEAIEGKPHKAGDIVDVCGVLLQAQENGLLKPLPPVAVKPVSGVQWLTRDDLKFAQFRDTSPLQSAWWGEWYFRQTFAYNAPVTVASKPSRVLKPRKVCLPNMQRRNAPKPVKVEKREPLRDTVLQIVSRIETPLTGSVRRIA